MLRKYEDVVRLHCAGKCRATRDACGIFEAGTAAAIHGDAHALERHIELCGKPAAMFGPARAVCVQRVIDVDRVQPACTRA